VTITREYIKSLVGPNSEWVYRAANNPDYDVKISNDGSIILVSRLNVISAEEMTRHMEAYKTITTKQ